MDRMKKIVALAVAILTVAVLASASSWEGSAMMGSFGDFPSGGYFAACNSFPRNTAVEVTNLETGKTVTVIIVRGLDNPGVFMMLSAEAAEALGLRQGKITRVRAVEPRSMSALSPTAGSRSALDSDFNPRLLATEELKRMGYDIAEAPGETAVSPKTPIAKVVVPETEAVPGPSPESKQTIPAGTDPASTPAQDTGPKLVQDLIRPDPSASVPEPFPVPSPEAPRVAADERPDAINGGKPKPVRTVVLPELPEPSAPSAQVTMKPLPVDTDAEPRAPASPGDPGSETPSLVLPVPDETPLRVNPSPVPRRLEALATLPDVLERSRIPQLAAEIAGSSLDEPRVGSIPLAVSGPVPADHVVAHELRMPQLRGGDSLVSLDWPELEADEIPDVVLARLAEPVQFIPATSLAEGEVIFPSTGTPSAVALETPSLGAAETRVALTAPDVESVDQAGIPDDGLPGEVIVVLEPTDLRPPVLDAPVVAEAPSASEKPPVVKAPAPVVKVPEAAKPEPTAFPVKPSMAIGTLEKGRHYIQVGVYRTEAAAHETVAALRMDYVMVLENPVGSTSRIWKIFVGPMGRDESGMALLRVRSLGYRDAFLKIGG